MNIFRDRTGKILILGIGNDILTDDGIGIRLVEDLEQNLRGSQFVFEKATVGGLEILETICGYQCVIFLDAIKTPDGKPGDLYHIKLDEFMETLHLSNLHDISFLESIQLGKKLGYPVPEQMHILATEIKEDRVFSTSLTPEMASRYSEIFQETADFIRSIVT